jgi:signal transduction histidine kinase
MNDDLGPDPGFSQRFRARAIRDLRALDARGRLGEPPSPLRFALATFATVLLLGLTTFLIGRVERFTTALLIAAVGVLALAIAVGFALAISQFRSMQQIDDANAELLGLHAEQERQRQHMSDVLHDARALTAAMGAALHALERGEERSDVAAALAASLDQLRETLRPAPGGTLAAVPVRDLCDLLAPFAALHAVDLSVNLPDDAPVMADTDATLAILRNLLDNARKYAPGSPVWVSCEDAGPFLKLFVDDAGPGIDVDDPDAPFLPGYRTGGATQGFGAGLAIARRMAEDMNGALWYEPRPDGGSRFVLKLPRARAEGERS